MMNAIIIMECHRPRLDSYVAFHQDNESQGKYSKSEERILL